MKRLLAIVFLLCCIPSLWSQTEGDFPSQNASGKLYLGTDSDLSFSVSQGDRFVSGRIGIVGQYFVSKNLALGLSVGAGGNRTYFDNDINVFKSNSLRLSTYLQALFFPMGGRSQAIQPFIQTQIALNRGRNQNVPEFGSPQNTPSGSTSLGLAPGVSIALPNDALLNVSTTLVRLGLSRQGKGRVAVRDGFVSGGLNSGITVAYIMPI